MLLTLYYMYATLLQCWRLALTKAKLTSHLSDKSSVVLFHKNRPADKSKNNIEHLLHSTEDKVACTVVPKKAVSLNAWLSFSSCKFFPFSKKKICLSGVPNITLLLQADMKNCNNSIECNQLQVSELGEPVAWMAADNFSIVLKTDLDKFTKLMLCFLANPIAINDGMEVLRVEMVELEGEPKLGDGDRIFKKYKWPKNISNQRQWRHLTEDLKSIFKKISQAPHSQNGNVCNDVYTPKPLLETEKITTKTHLSISKRDMHTDNTPKIKIDKPEEIVDKHKTDKKPNKKEKIEKVKISETSSEGLAKQNSSKKKEKTSPHKEQEVEDSIKENVVKTYSAATSQKISPVKIVLNAENSNDVKSHDKKQNGEGTSKTIDMDKDIDEVEKMAVETQKADSKSKEKSSVEKCTHNKSGTKERTEHFKTKGKINKKKYTQSIDEKLENLNTNLSKMAETRDKLEMLKNKHAKDSKPVKQSSSSIDESKHDNSNDNSDDQIEFKEKVEKTVKHKRTKEKSHNKQQTSTSIEEEVDQKKLKHKHKKEKRPEKLELSSSLEDDQLDSINGKSECLESKDKSSDKIKQKRPKELSQEQIKQSSSLDRIKHKHDTRSKREKFAKRHSDDKILNKNVEIDKDISKHGEKDFILKKRFVKAKPPNILVFADSVQTRENAKLVLKQVLNENKYVIYDMSSSGHMHLADNCTLAVICGNVPPNLTTQLLRYLLTGGQMLCLCSDLLNSVLHTFTTAEVREHELVRFSYGEWRRVRMMHHIFCYQASPVRKNFSQDSDAGSSSNHSPVAPRTPSTVELHHDGVTYTVYVQVLGTEETWHTPSILLAKIRNGTGKAVFSQVHLEIDPENFEEEESVCTALKDSDKYRLEILKDILSNHLHLDCNKSENPIIEYVPAYVLGRTELKNIFLSEQPGLKENMLRLPKLTIQFCGKGEQPQPASDRLLPVLVQACPANFSTVQYFETLKTESLGRLAIYSDVLTSSMDVITGAKLRHGFTVIPKIQTSGVGRGGNIWLSPQGSAMYSMQIHIPVTSLFASRLSLVQHLVAIAAVSSIKSLPGYEKLEIGVKWPNDIYAYSSVKIGGVIVNSMVDSNAAICNIGFGINLNNAQPTTCIKSIITKYNEQNNTKLLPFSLEQYLALTFNELERILHIVQEGNLNYLFELYYKYWLHCDSIVSVQTADNVIKDVSIVGIDDYGFLMVRAKDGTTSSVQPDNNTFDMMQGLIAPKIR